MAILLLDPALTCGGEEAEVFALTFFEEANSHVSVSSLRSNAALQTAVVGVGDEIVLFNRPDQNYTPAVLRLLRRAAAAAAQITPVAMEKNSRRPPQDIGAEQSFDVSEELARGGLERAQVPVVAAKLAQTAVARALPTLARERMRLFLSHRRSDGEPITRSIWKELRLRGQAQGVFRDLADVREGEDAQDGIMANLTASDIVVFLDTPQAGESEWVAKELETALALSLPILWVRIGSPEGRAKLRVKPGPAPHLDLSLVEPAADGVDSELADKILHAAFAVSRETGLRVLEARDQLEVLADQGHIELRVVDSQQMLYEVRLRRQARRYQERPHRHLIQFFGRWPDEEDTRGFGACARGAGFEAHSIQEAPYDAAVLAAPIPPPLDPPTERDAGGLPCYVDAAEAYVRHLKEIVNPEPRQQGWGLVLSGAFPDEVTVEQEQEIKQAVRAFARAVFLRGGTVIFGGHPTFQPMIFELGRELFNAQERPERTRLYVSEHFLTPAAAQELRRDASTQLVPAVGDDRGRSLTAMRNAMLGDDRAQALIAIGGRGHTPGRAPGVDEEVELAEGAGLPVFLIGAAGGRAATLATRRREAGWRPPLNRLTVEENEEMYQSRDYAVLADQVLTHLGF